MEMRSVCFGMKNFEMRDLRERAAEILREVLWLENPVRVDTALGSVVLLPEEKYDELLAAKEKIAEGCCGKELCDGRGEDDQDD